MPSKWLRRHKKDYYHRLAKERGYRSRAAFKLIQVTKRYRFLRHGDRVLDMGSAPGGWAQAARQIVGVDGYVLAVDKEPIKSLPYENVITVTADITQSDIIERIRSVTGTLFDVVTSDLSPNVSGIWEVDHARQIDLASRSLHIANSILRKGGNMLVKVFQGSELRDFQTEFKSCFQTLRIVKPPASRPESAELYFLGLSFIGQRSEN